MQRSAPLMLVFVLALVSPACGGDDLADVGDAGSDSGDGDGDSGDADTGDGDGDGDGDNGDGDGDNGDGDGDNGDGDGDNGDGDGDTGDGDGDGDGDTGDGDGDTGDGDGDVGLTWANGAADFFETYCWECHGPGDQLRDYSLLSDVMIDSNSIRCGVAATQQDNCGGEPPPKQFPIGNNLPTDAERDMIIAWIEAGMPE